MTSVELEEHFAEFVHILQEPTLLDTFKREYLRRVPYDCTGTRDWWALSEEAPPRSFAATPEGVAEWESMLHASHRFPLGISKHSSFKDPTQLTELRKNMKDAQSQRLITQLITEAVMSPWKQSQYFASGCTTRQFFAQSSTLLPSSLPAHCGGMSYLVTKPRLVQDQAFLSLFVASTSSSSSSTSFSSSSSSSLSSSTLSIVEHNVLKELGNQRRLKNIDIRVS